MEILSAAINIFVIVVLLILTFSFIKFIFKKETKSSCCGKGEDCCRESGNKECTCKKN